MRGFLITSVLVLGVIGIGVGIESGSNPPGLFGSGRAAFIAAFPDQVSLATYENPNMGFGYFEPGVFSEVQLWAAPNSASFVEVSSFRRTFAQAFADLVKTAELHHSVVTVNRGVASTRLVWHIPPGAGVPPWSIAVVELRGTEVFYALGSGDTYAAADLLASSFRLPAG